MYFKYIGKFLLIILNKRQYDAVCYNNLINNSVLFIHENIIIPVPFM